MSDSAASDRPTPPLTPELIADLHAGILPADLADSLWPLAREDAEAAAVLAALDQAAADLAELDGDIEPMPDLVAARLRNAVRAEGAVPTPPRSTARFAAAAAVALVLGMGAFVGFDHSTPPSTEGTTGQSALPAPIEVADGTVPRSQARAVRGTMVVGRLTDPRLRSDCLSANGYAAGTALLGSSPARVGERRGTLLLISGDRPPNVIALVVGDRCSAANPDLLAVTTVTD